MLYSFNGINGEQLAAVQVSNNCEDVGIWLQANGTTKMPVEIKTWSDEMEGCSPMKNPKNRAHFIENCSKLGLNPETNTTFDWLETDDRASFSGKSV